MSVTAIILITAVDKPFRPPQITIAPSRSLPTGLTDSTDIRGELFSVEFLETVNKEVLAGTGKMAEPLDGKMKFE
jgi:hypothetical protein